MEEREETKRKEHTQTMAKKRTCASRRAAKEALDKPDFGMGETEWWRQNSFSLSRQAPQFSSGPRHTHTHTHDGEGYPR